MLYAIFSRKEQKKEKIADKRESIKICYLK
jgi:hypothetical protein